MGWCVSVCLSVSWLTERTHAPLISLLLLHTFSHLHLYLRCPCTQRSQLPTYNTYCDITTTHLLIRECEVREGNTQSYSLFKNLLKIFREQILNFEFWRKCSHKITKFLEEYPPMGDIIVKLVAACIFYFYWNHSLTELSRPSINKQSLAQICRNVLVGVK